MSMAAALPNYEAFAGCEALGETCRIGIAGGLEAVVLPFGAIVQSLSVPCRDGVRQVLANYSSLAEYERDPAYVGCIIGRTANRIRAARFSRAGRTFRLTANDGEHSLHGGREGFNRRLWTVELHSQTRVRLSCHSDDGDQGYPGALGVGVSFELIDPMSLCIRYEAYCTAPTPVDLTHHLYFNLGGAGAPLMSHRLQIASEEVLELDASYLPTGRRLGVAGTPFDFAQPKPLSEILTAAHPQLTAIGLNQAWILPRPSSRTTGPLARSLRLIAPDNSLALSLETDQPCLQLYSGLDPAICPGGALAIEPQGFINAVNEPAFPSAWLEPGQRYERSTYYRFGSR